MTEQHPLTHEICERLSCFPFEDCDEEGIMTDMRAAYDKGAEDRLKQVIEWLNETIFERGSSLEAVNIPEELKKAMRPQEDNNG